MKLSGKVAIITGAGAGIGAASAELFALEGAAVVVTDIDANAIVASNGSLIFNTGRRIRMADVMMRVGSTALDNTHGQARPSGIVSGQLPLADDNDAIARVLWLLTNREYDQASATFLKVKTSTTVQSEEEDKSPDFSAETAQTHSTEAKLPPPLQQKVWEARIRAVSKSFLQYPEVYNAVVSMQTSNDRTLLANSEGAALVRPGS